MHQHLSRFMPRPCPYRTLCNCILTSSLCPESLTLPSDSPSLGDCIQSILHVSTAQTVEHHCPDGLSIHQPIHQCWVATNLSDVEETLHQLVSAWPPSQLGLGEATVNCVLDEVQVSMVKYVITLQNELRLTLQYSQP